MHCSCLQAQEQGRTRQEHPSDQDELHKLLLLEVHEPGAQHSSSNSGSRAFVDSHPADSGLAVSTGNRAKQQQQLQQLKEEEEEEDGLLQGLCDSAEDNIQPAQPQPQPPPQQQRGEVS